MSDNVAHALGGAGGGIVSMLLTYPLITVSSRLQVQRKQASASSTESSANAIQKIIKQEGIAGLFSGVESAVFGNALTNGVYYFFFEWVKKRFEQASGRRNMTTGQSMLAGALAGAAVVLITNPIWVVNMRQTTKKNSLDEDEEEKDVSSGEASTKKTPAKQSFWKMLFDIVQEDGVQALWQGTLPALILVINPIIQYTVFERIKAGWERSRKLGNLDFFMLGAISKLAATAITYPYIVVKSRMQLRQSKDAAQRYNSVLDGLRKIVKQEGVQGLYKGIEFKLVQSVLTAAFLFMAKEQFYRYAVTLLALTGSQRRTN
ncbi:hypothetical protein H4R34_003594 [Dimargaris verticillata]|uniref:Mitochondrial carrier domain-containing protein n=1 Tax=Dimargaris verticillata TaxID=2761393 RepID=A0A9W8B774_9FUNG|nr:hypothetical protein H4R34_003594 [Dimargaris verticillata]